MTFGKMLDRTPATIRGSNTPTVSSVTGDFVVPAGTSDTIMIHVSKPDMREAERTGIHVQEGDVIVHADESAGLKETVELEFWDGIWVIVTEFGRYDQLKAIVNHKRRRWLVRRAPEPDMSP